MKHHTKIPRARRLRKPEVKIMSESNDYSPDIANLRDDLTAL